ncbi:MAG TPA: DUF1178 family protein [Ideonella sp.]|jgi:hypothetical protein|nr:DUF1178 family protein [Ideonella sp.]
MKVLDLRCAHGHGFEGWFASEEDFLQQQERGLVECPLCGDKTIGRLPSAPRLNFGASAPAAAAPARNDAVQPQPATLQHLWMEAVKHVIARTEDVGERFPEEARRIHYGEAEERGIRGQATEQERAALQEEGIEVVALPVPPALKGPSH